RAHRRIRHLQLHAGPRAGADAGVQRRIGRDAPRLPDRVAHPHVPADAPVAQEGEMTAKSDFTPDEWKLIQEGPATAGMILISAERGGTSGETSALAGAYTDARKKPGESDLLDELVASKPEFDRHRYKTTEELHAEGMKQIGAAVTLLRSKATPDEV